MSDQFQIEYVERLDSFYIRLPEERRFETAWHMDENELLILSAEIDRVLKERAQSHNEHTIKKDLTS